MGQRRVFPTILELAAITRRHKADRARMEVGWVWWKEVLLFLKALQRTALKNIRNP